MTEEEKQKQSEDFEIELKEKAMVLKGNKHLGDSEIKLSDLAKVRPLGQGASGFVELCVHIPTKKYIALKAIALQSNETVKKQLILELKTLHDCDSDYIVRSYGSFLKDGYVHIALEYMDGSSLADVLKEVGKMNETILGMITF